MSNKGLNCRKMVSNYIDLEAKKQNSAFCDDMVKLIDTQVVQNIDSEYQFNNRFWIKNNDDKKPFFKYEEHARNKESKELRTVQKTKKKTQNVNVLPTKQLKNTRNSLPFNHTLFSDCKCKLKDKSVVNDCNNNENTIKRKVKSISPKLSRSIETSKIVEVKNNQQSTLLRNQISNKKGLTQVNNIVGIRKLTSTTSTTISTSKQNKKISSDKRVNFLPLNKSDTHEYEAERMIKKKCSCACSPIIDSGKNNLKFESYNFKPIDFNYDQKIAVKAKNCELLTNEAFPNRDELVDLSLSEDKINVSKPAYPTEMSDDYDYELDEFLRFEYYSTLRNNLKQVYFNIFHHYINCMILIYFLNLFKEDPSKFKKCNILRNIFILLIMLVISMLVIFNSVFIINLFTDNSNVTHFIQDELKSKLFSIKYPFNIDLEN